jgi:hypothetical protein
MDNHDEHHRHDKQRLFLINQQTVPQADVKTGTHRGGGENVNVFDKQICVLCHRCRPGAGQRQNPGGTNGRISEQKGRGALGTEKEQKWPPVMSRRLKALTPSEPVSNRMSPVRLRMSPKQQSYLKATRGSSMVTCINQ